MNKTIVIGSGLQGEAIAFDFLKYNPGTELIVADFDWEKAESLRKKLSNPKVEAMKLDASDKEDVKRIFSACSLAFNASSYEFNFELSKIATETGCNFVDLGGNPEVVKKQFSLKPTKIAIIPDAGIAPGAVSILAMLGIQKWGIPEKLKIRVGGLPVNPCPPWNYSQLFSIKGLINEYKEDVEVIEDGKYLPKESLGDVEEVDFEDERFKRYFGTDTLHLEAALTSGGSSTLADSFIGKIKNLNYKTLRYTGHWEMMQKHKNNGDFEGEKRTVFEKKLAEELPIDKKDMMLVKVVFVYENNEKELVVVDFYDEKTGHTAMQRTTGYTASIIGSMVLSDKINRKGVLKIEESIDPELFVSEWKKRGIDVHES